MRSYFPLMSSCCTRPSGHLLRPPKVFPIWVSQEQSCLRLPLWGAATFPCPGQQGAAASQWKGRQVCSAGGKHPCPQPFFTVGRYTTHQWMRQKDTRHRPLSWLSARGGGLDEERRWRARLTHPRRRDTRRHLPAGHHMDASDTGKGFPVPTRTAALGSHTVTASQILGFPPVAELRRLKHKGSCPRSPVNLMP